jgi:hypothetical protein
MSRIVCQTKLALDAPVFHTVPAQREPPSPFIRGSYHMRTNTRILFNLLNAY